jgi:hypothetical protein
VEQEKEPGMSKLALALGAASLFLFVVGLKRSFRTDDGKEILRDGEPAKPTKEPRASRRRGRLRNAG